MAQIREFESTTESYFILDGVNYPKVYEAMLDNGYSDTKIKLVGTNRDTTPLVFSTEYTNIRVDGDSFDTAFEAISRLNQIVFSKGGGSGTGGATNVITEDSDTVAFTGNGTVGNPLSAKGYNGSYSTTETLTGGTWIDGKPIYKKTFIGAIEILADYIDTTLLNIDTRIDIRSQFTNGVQNFTNKHIYNEILFNEDIVYMSTIIINAEFNPDNNNIFINNITSRTKLIDGASFTPDEKYSDFNYHITILYTKTTD